MRVHSDSGDSCSRQRVEQHLDVTVPMQVGSLFRQLIALIARKVLPAMFRFRTGDDSSQTQNAPFCAGTFDGQHGEGIGHQRFGWRQAHDTCFWVNSLLGFVKRGGIIVGEITLQSSTFLPSVKQGLAAYAPFLQSFLTPIIDAPKTACRGRKRIGSNEVATLTAIHGLKGHHIAPHNAVVAYLKRADVGQRFEAIARKNAGRSGKRTLHGTIAPLSPGIVTGSDVAHLCIIAVRHGNKGYILNISVAPLYEKIAIGGRPLSVSTFFHHCLGSSHPLHGMRSINPPATGTITIGDVQFECQTAPFGLGCRKFQMLPPGRAECVFRSLCRCVACMLLVVIDHPTETSLLESLGIGGDTFVGGVLVSKKPPGLHAVVGRGMTPQALYLPVDGTAMLLCAGSCQHNYREKK